MNGEKIPLRDGCIRSRDVNTLAVYWKNSTLGKDYIFSQKNAHPLQRGGESNRKGVGVCI